MPENDIDLKHAFDRAGGLAPNAPAALAGLRTRIRKAHQRRAMTRGGAGLLGVVAVGGVIMNIGGDGSSTEVASTGPTASDPSSVTTTTPASTTTTIASSSSAPSSSGQATASTPAPTTGSVTTAYGSATTIDDSIPGTTVVPTTLPASGQVAVFNAEGGTIVVDYTSSAMALTSVAANPGWTVAESRAQPDDIEVRFENEDGDDSRIRVRLVDGQPEQDDDRRGSDDSGDDDSGDDDSGGEG